ncbi:MAG: glycosyltransferase family 2 protein [Verrucomicrobia bacterium]|jgi:poly-beta-1,6-N-acetyl-D-glucosamine synthase|nr:glycosyltransferase family 2 protein [Verrucomicrobiota bacterium]
MSFVLITPVRNEESTIEETLLSMVNQTVRPAEWVIVDDNSTDQTYARAKPYADAHGFIHLVRNTNRKERDMAARIHAIEFGIENLTTDDYAWIGILDGDIKLDPTYYESMLAKFEACPNLGLAGGALYEKMGDLFVDQRIHEDSVAGGVQLFRRECYEAIGGLTPLPKGGTDSLAEVMVRMHGWKTKTFSDTPFYHLRPLNAETGSFFYGKFQLGERDYMIGNHVLFQLFRCAYRIKERPYVISSILRLLGYTWLWASRSKRYFPDDVVRFKQAEQLHRLKRLFHISGELQRAESKTNSRQTNDSDEDKQ